MKTGQEMFFLVAVSLALLTSCGGGTSKSGETTSPPLLVLESGSLPPTLLNLGIENLEIEASFNNETGTPVLENQIMTRTETQYELQMDLPPAKYTLILEIFHVASVSSGEGGVVALQSKQTRSPIARIETELHYQGLRGFTQILDFSISDVALDLEAIESISAGIPPDDTTTEVVDTDGDGVADTLDNCLTLSNTDQKDTDKDGSGNACDPDDDGDLIPDLSDGVPLNPAESVDTDGDGTGNATDPDDDGDGTPDDSDKFPTDPKENNDSDNDGYGDGIDPDDDNDGISDPDDAFKVNPLETKDTDRDGIGDNADTDDDGDNTPDTTDQFPLDPKETTDTDGDGTGDAGDLDDDGDGVSDVDDDFRLNPAETTDTDLDGTGDNADTDDDGDGTPDTGDPFPLNPLESIDTDSDGTGDRGDIDDDGDGVSDVEDVFPLNSSEAQDTDTDGTGDNADTDDDNDGVPDPNDAFPLNALESVDTDGDGTGDRGDIDDDDDGVIDIEDAYRLNPNESRDTDRDGTGNNADLDDDGDGTLDINDAFPEDPGETTNTDGDSLGDVSDTDDDNDGVADSDDAFRVNPAESEDTDGDGTGNNADADDDNDGVSDAQDNCDLVAGEAASVDNDSDGIGNGCDPDDDNDGFLDTNDPEIYVRNYCGNSVIEVFNTETCDENSLYCVQCDSTTLTLSDDGSGEDLVASNFLYFNSDPPSVIFRASNGSGQPVGLYSVSPEGGEVRTLFSSPTADVASFKLSLNAATIFFTTTDLQTRVGSLYSVVFSGGSPARLLSGNINVTGVFYFQTVDSLGIFVGIDTSVPGNTNTHLYRVSLTGAGLTDLTPNFRGVTDFEVNGDNSYYAFKGTNAAGAAGLYAVPFGGNPVTRLSGLSATVSSDYRFSADGQTIVYREQPQGRQTFGLHANNTGNIGQGILIAESNNFSVIAFELSAANIVYKSETTQLPRTQSLFTVQGGNDLLLSGALETIETFKIAPDDLEVVFTAKAGAAPASRLYKHRINAVENPIPLSPDTGGATKNVSSFSISPDSSFAVYQGDIDVDGAERLYHVNLSGPPVPVALSGGLGVNTQFDVSNHAISADNRTILFTGTPQFQFGSPFYRRLYLTTTDNPAEMATIPPDIGASQNKSAGYQYFFVTEDTTPLNDLIVLFTGDLAGNGKTRLHGRKIY